jgi:hypothetical protein
MLDNILQKAVKSLVSSHFKCLKTNEMLESSKHMNGVQFAQEYKTIKVGSHRQSGHSTAAIDILEKYAKHGLLVVPFYTMVSRYAKSDKYTVVCDSYFKFIGYPDDAFDVIVLDCASMLSTSFKHNLTYKFNQAELFLHLQ